MTTVDGIAQKPNAAVDVHAVSYAISEVVKPAITATGEYVVAFYDPEFVMCIPSDEAHVGELTVRFQKLFVKAIERYEQLKTKD